MEPELEFQGWKLWINLSSLELTVCLVESPGSGKTELYVPQPLESYFESNFNFPRDIDVWHSTFLAWIALVITIKSFFDVEKIAANKWAIYFTNVNVYTYPVVSTSNLFYL